MPTVIAFKIEGLKLWFWSDDHEPPHFHVKKAGEWEVKVRFLLKPSKMIKIKWAEKTPPSKLLKQIRRLAEENRAELLKEWEKRLEA